MPLITQAIFSWICTNMVDNISDFIICAYCNTFSSSRENPRPARTRVWYLNVGQWTIGLNGPATGLGIIAAAFFLRWSRRRCLRAGWLNQHRTNLCQSLWKWPFGIILFPFPISANLLATTHLIKLSKHYKKANMSAMLFNTSTLTTFQEFMKVNKQINTKQPDRQRWSSS